jgi:hypothetical protein
MVGRYRASTPPEAASQSKEEEEQAAQTAHDLFATLPDKIGKAFLLLIPHSALHLLPLHTALLDGKPLIEHYPLVYLPNAAIANVLLKRQKEAEQPTQPLVMGPVDGDNLPSAKDET